MSEYSVKMFPLKLKPEDLNYARYLAQETAKVWNQVVQIHAYFYFNHQQWISEKEMKSDLKRKFKLHSQTIQAVIEEYYEAASSAQANKAIGRNQIRYPHRRKRWRTVTWKKDALKLLTEDKLRLSNGYQKALIVNLPEYVQDYEYQEAQLVWHGDRYWLHITCIVEPRSVVEGQGRAAIDPGEVQAITISNGEEHLIISGRGLRSLVRQRNRRLGKFQRKLAKLEKGSRKWRKINRKKQQFLAKINRSIAHLENCITAHAIRWCLDHKINTVYYGRPKGISQSQDNGRYHNQRLSQWRYYSTYQRFCEKAKQHGIKVIEQEESYTSKFCPCCGQLNRSQGRTYHCSKCKSSGHRDVIGAYNILAKAEQNKLTTGRELPREKDTHYIAKPDQQAAKRLA